MQRLLLLILTLVLPALAAADGNGPQPGFTEADREIERFLLNAEVVGSKEIGSGITKPLKLELELDGETRSAAFKSVDMHIVKLSRFKTADAEFNFTDNHVYERAAYVLDRLIGMHMTPVTVLREIDGKEGAVTDWISDAVNEMERRNNQIEPPDMPALEFQMDTMEVFDVLIRNTDRNLSNQLITLSDWKLHLIDHSRAFRTHKKIPKEFIDEPVRIPRTVLDGLRRLDQEILRTELKGILSRAQIKSLLARRDRIVVKFERDIERYGEGFVFGEDARE